MDKNLFVYLICLLLVFSFVQASSETQQHESFISKIGNFITGWIVWPGQPSIPSTGTVPNCMVEESSWVCGAYGICVSGSQTKTCTSNCNTTKTESQACTVACQNGVWTNTSTYSCVNGIRQMQQSRTTSPNGCNTSAQLVSYPCLSGQICSGVGICSSPTVDCQVGSWIDTTSYRCSGDMKQKQQNRTVSPFGCNISSQWINSSCSTGQVCSGLGECIVPVSSCLESNWVSTNGVCNSSSVFVKSWTKQGTCSGGISHPSSEIVSCSYILPVCTSFSYSDWSACNSNGQKSRMISFSSPSGCSGGNIDTLTIDCLCTEDNWKKGTLTPSECPSSGKQTQSWSKIGNCINGVSHVLSEEVSCNYVAKCTNECDVNEKSCFSTGYKVCQTASNGCTVWGNLVSCNSSQYCENGACITNISLNNVINEDELAAQINATLTQEEREGEVIENMSIVSSVVGGVKIFNLTEDNKIKVSLSYLENIPNFNSSKIKVSEGDVSNRNYILIQNDNIGSYNKSIYFTIKQSSPGVCLKDEESVDVSQILASCNYIACPGKKDQYECVVLSSDATNKQVVVNGLTHSGVLEVLEQAPIVSPTNAPKGGGGGGGGSGGTTTNTTDNSSDSFVNAGGLVNNGDANSGAPADLASGVSSNKSTNVFSSVGDSLSSVNLKVIYMSVGAIVFLIVIIFLIIKLRRRMVVPNKPLNGIDEEEGKLKKINILLSEANLFLSQNKIVEAEGVYNSIQGVYSSLKKADPETFEKAKDLYSRISSKK